MSFPKFLVLVALFMFGAIAVVSLLKGKKEDVQNYSTEPVELALNEENVEEDKPELAKERVIEVVTENTLVPQNSEGLPSANRGREFFAVRGAKFPIVETITYTSRVDWLKGRPAWLSDYSSHYKTSRHFIAHSLNGKADYFKQNVSEGDRFNVLNPDKNINFYLLVDLSRSKMWFYYLDLDTNERVLVKTYPLSLGRFDPLRASGSLTPVGKYSLGDRVAIYSPGKKGLYNGQQIEMIEVFGSRWIPFDEEISACTEPAKGLGVHGLPWSRKNNAEFGQDIAMLGKYSSDGCVRLAKDDMEELFAIIISRPTIIELVRDFHDAVLPGEETGD